MQTSATMEWDEVLAGLDKLGGELATQLARSMAVAGGKVLRDEAIARVPRDEGVLASAIYLAYSERRTSDGQVVYSVTWNTRKAPHGHLVEFGHLQRFKVVKDRHGNWWTFKNVPLPSPKRVGARPFLRPAYEAAFAQAQKAMIERARVRFPELLRESGHADGT